VPLTLLLDQPLYTGSGASDETPWVYPVALNGRGYMLDLASGAYRRQSIPLLRNQADTGNLPGEQSLSPEALWRRSQESWHRGAGQTYLDRPDSDPARFRTSKGVDVWERWALKLLNATNSIRTSTATNLRLVVVGDYLYVADGTEVYHTATLTSPTWTAAAINVAEAAATVQSVASDGYRLYAALGVNGIHRTEAGAAVSSHYSDLAASLVGYVKDRLMAAGNGADKHKLYNVTGAGAAPAALFSHPNTDWTWVGFAEGPGHIYAAGYSGDKSVVYRTAVKADGTALDAPVVAGRLPEGEVLRSVGDYLGQFVLLGTDKGFRVALPDGDGNLVIGARVDTGSAVRCFEGQDRFVWYGLTNFDGDSTGLGRMDLSADTGGGNVPVPAYASDLMASAQGDVLSAVTFDNRRVFTVSGSGVHAEGASKVPSGTLDTGYITFGIPDDKVAMYLDVRCRPLDGSFTYAVSADDGTFTSVGTLGTADEVKVVFPIGQVSGATFEGRATLTRSGSDTTLGPEVTRHTLRSYPGPTRGEVFEVPLLLAEQELVRGRDRSRVPADELDAIRALVNERRLVTYQEGDQSYSVLVEDFVFVPSHEASTPAAGWQGTCVVRLKAYTE
jgi:hypothetical protein